MDLNLANQLNRAVLDVTGALVVVTDPEGRILLFNRACERLSGYAEEDVVGRHYGFLLRPEDREAVGRVVTQVQASGEPREHRNEWVGKDGTLHDVVWANTVVRDERGEPRYFVATGVDVTNARASQTELRRTSSRLSALVGHLQEGVLVEDEAGQILVVNRHYTQLMGLEAPETLVGTDRTALARRTSGLFTGPEDFLRRITELRRRRQLVQEEELALPDGRVFSRDYIPIATDSIPAGSLWVYRDITARKRSEDALQESELRFRQAFTHAPIGMAIVAPDGRFVRVNPALCRMVGYSEEELLQKGFPAITHPDDLDDDLALAEQLFRGDIDSYEMEKRYVHREGHPVWALLGASAVPGPAPEPIYAVAQVVDITDRKRAEDQVRESERRYRGLFENASDMILGLDRNGVIRYANPAWRQRTGYGDGWVGRPIRDVLTDASLPALRELYGRALAGQEAGRYEAEVRTRDGRILEVEGTLSFRREKGDPVEILAIFDDVTARRAAERLKEEFVSMVSHELRTPLTSIRGSLGLLASGKLGELSDAGARMMGIAVQNTDRLIRLINDILDLERLETGQLPLERELAGIGPVMTAAVDDFEAQARAAEVTLDVEPPATRLEIDPHRIRQALDNLLSNAIKFSDPGGRIRLWTERNDGELVVRVSDQGRGIPSDKLDSIFGRFQQVDASDSREKGGTGLGLAICRSIVEQHGGRIWVDSRLGEGSVFSFSLPLPVRSEGAEEGAREKGPARVLLCGGDDGARSAMAALLERSGYGALPVASADEAVRLAAAERPDVILLDLLLPGPDALPMMTALKRDRRTRDIPVVVLSRLSPVDGDGGLRPDRWLTGPVGPEALAEALSSVLDRPATSPRILLVEDDGDLAELMAQLFARRGIRVEHAATVRAARELTAASDPTVVVLDLLLPDGRGEELVEWMRGEDRFRSVPLVVYTALELGPEERERLRVGPTEYMTKTRIPLNVLEDRVVRLIEEIVPGSVGVEGGE